MSVSEGDRHQFMPGHVKPEVVDVRFGSGSGGLHDVVLGATRLDAESVWRNWSPVGDILAVGFSPGARGVDRVEARWFSKTGEIELCGSGAVAMAGVIFEDVPHDVQSVRLTGKYHNILARRNDQGVMIRLPNFELKHASPDDGVISCLGVDAPSGYFISERLRTHVVVLPDDEDVRSVRPGYRALRSICRPDLAAVIITSLRRDTGSYTFRYFTPWHDLDESPVAVSANSVLGPLWRAETGNTCLEGRQLTTAQPSFVVQVVEDGTWVRGEIRRPAKQSG